MIAAAPLLKPRSSGAVWPLCLVLSAGLIASAATAVAFGAVSIPVGKVFGIVADASGLLPATGDWTRAERNIVWELRLPRVLLAAVAGAGLASVGAVLQVLTRNPLADPYLFGVSAGAAFGAVVVILYLGNWAGPLTLPGAAFLGALASMALVFVAAGGKSGAPSSERLVLTGVAVAFVIQAGTNFMITSSLDRGAEAALFWLSGGLGASRWATIPAPCLITVLGIVWLVLRGPSINALAFGDDTAQSLGIDPHRLRMEMFAVTALITGAIVSATGGIGFVGLVLPHIGRFVVGGDLRRLLPVVAPLGALFLVWVDVLARGLFAPREIPLGVLTASIGGVFFLWLMRRRLAS